LTEGTEAAADVLTGAIAATAVEPQAGGATSATSAAPAAARGGCRNCGAALHGAYCSACGQPVHLHRSLAEIGHEILHAVFHFDGKVWRTLPELAFHPGRLTRRYIDGERAKFISPMALYLFTVFLMYAIFSVTGGALLDTQLPGAATFQIGNRASLEAVAQQMADVRRRLESPDLAAAERAELEQTLAGLESARAVMDALASGDLDRAAALENALDAAGAEAAPEPSAQSTPTLAVGAVRRALEPLTTNPSLVAYKVKTNGYKFAWALVPLSIPFMWLLFFWRRDLRMYDHAVFVTYSISFMMLLLILVSLLGTAGIDSGLLLVAAQIVPVVHMYKQLRGAYGLSRRGSLVRLFFLLIAAAIVLAVFVSLLLAIGMLG
jgi:hypothetical protein